MTDMTEEQAATANAQAIADFHENEAAESLGPTTPMFAEGKWYEIDTANLDGEVQEAFAQYRVANDAMKSARRDMEGMFETLVAARVPKTLVARFSYRFDKVSVSPVKARVASSKSGGKITL